MSIRISIILAALVVLFLAPGVLSSDVRPLGFSVSFAVLVQVVDEAGVPIEGASLQQVGFEVANAAKANRKHAMPQGFGPANRRSFSSILGLATLDLIYSRQTFEEIRMASPRTCEILVSANGYVDQNLLLSTVPLDFIDAGEGSAGLHIFKIIMIRK